ncbi:DNA-directed RNA polymerase III subunit [Mycena indigotica]|uniref:DNA-directed RNA polymerase III subunit n=1 Tax=Mycena indigotica TaxID=2126181 RepID=A0A8H6WGX1_9AGAR|nr:DNA-directed RNA polymerase III subunit [Mycena indigotica]KAF7316366.1 DNA-directed RNA polymerase III subunit [Mycena indigotica]
MAGRGRGGWGRGRGRGAAPPPLGLTHADLQNLSIEETPLYPAMIPPVLSDITEDEKKIAAYQTSFADRLRKSAYYIVESTKSSDLPRYSDKYRPSAASHPSLKKKDLHAPYFPPDVFDGYFNPRKKRKTAPKLTSTTKPLNIDDIADEEENENASNGSDAGSQAPSDYDVDEEYDNDYAENYFDNGEADDNDDLGGGGGDEGGGGGGGDYD